MNKIKEEMIHVPIFKYEQIMVYAKKNLYAKNNLYSSIYWQHLQEYC